ncbi:hypothetical protein CLU79DRAFT_378396 [Phycomyces nitens]|nr:hypothetical protein CLU79DRAFT_724135 [Phycomyces nitens]KAI9014412.1 hypothetical protein CLU79DRAFT_378396 [Phycomyces nitens]
MAELTNLSVVSENQPFLLELPCHGWVKSCYLLNSSSISEHLQSTPLNPLVALGDFLIQQKPSLRSIDRNDDETIQLLYAIAQQIFSDGLKQNESVITAEDLHEIYDQCTRARSYLLEDVLDPTWRKRTLDCLNQVLLKINETNKEPAVSMPNSSSDSTIKDWQFVDKYHNDHGGFNWETVFELVEQDNYLATIRDGLVSYLHITCTRSKSNNI